LNVSGRSEYRDSKPANDRNEKMDMRRGVYQMGTLEQIQFEILSIVRDLIPLLSHPGAHVQFLCRQFYSIQSLTNRGILGQIFKALSLTSECKSSLSVVAPVLEDLCSFSVDRVQEPDYLRRMNAYAQLMSNLRKWTDEQITPILYCMLHDIYDEELSIRSQASHNLVSLLAHFATQSKTPSPFIAAIIFPAIKKGK
jgi:hypothetical protein